MNKSNEMLEDLEFSNALLDFLHEYFKQKYGIKAFEEYKLEKEKLLGMEQHCKSIKEMAEEVRLYNEYSKKGDKRKTKGNRTARK